MDLFLIVGFLLWCGIFALWWTTKDTTDEQSERSASKRRHPTARKW